MKGAWVPAVRGVGLKPPGSRKSLSLASIVLHRDNPAVPEGHRCRGLLWPIRAADFARMRDDDDRIVCAVAELQIALRETLLKAVAKGPHHILAVVTAPLAGVERAPLDFRIENLLDRLEIACPPGLQAIPRNFSRCLAHVLPIPTAIVPAPLSRITAPPTRRAYAAIEPMRPHPSLRQCAGVHRERRSHRTPSG